MNVYLVRHAKAGSRQRWDGPDEARPLTKAGQKQARRLVDLLAHQGLAELRSSPYVRCVETLEPLGEAVELPVVDDERLAEGAGSAGILEIIDGATAPVALCTHGDVLLDALYAISRRGTELPSDRIEKGSTWVLQIDDGHVAKARYLPPPS